MAHPSLSPAEIIRRGQNLYEKKIRPKVEIGNHGKVLVIDVESGDYEVGDDHLAVSDRAAAKHPGAALFTVRIGYPAVGRLGGRLRAKQDR